MFKTGEPVHISGRPWRTVVKLCDFVVCAVHPDALGDYKDVDTSRPNCVVLADATSSFTYESLNSAFQLLINMDKCDNQDGSPLIALGKG